MSRGFKSIIFDLDGTLIDSSTGILWALKTAFSQCKVSPLSPWSPSLIGPPLRQIISQQSESQDSLLLDSLCSSFINLYDSNGYRLSNPYNGVEPLLDELLEKGCRLFIVTNKRIVPTNKILNYLNWNSKFEGVFGIDSFVDIQFAKKENIISRITIDFKLAKKNTLYIGDRLEDYEAAVSSEIEFVNVTWGFGESHGLLPKNNKTATSADALRKLLLVEFIK
jgi:phosphoglycolate phosphatase